MFYKLIFSVMFGLSIQLSANVFSTIKSFQASFEQTITNSSKTTITYKGEIFIKDDSKILWQYKTPIVKNVYILDNFAIIDEPELEQAIYTSLDKEINLFKILQEAKQVDTNHYQATLNDMSYTIKLINNQITTISYKDELENNVSIHFSNITQNHTIDAELFQFFPPASYDIIRK
ncbi:MAG: LolA-like outer membrane lipoprotein chaperone [Arcobacteraceae bacterium]